LIIIIYRVVYHENASVLFLLFDGNRPSYAIHTQHAAQIGCHIVIQLILQTEPMTANPLHNTREREREREKEREAERDKKRGRGMGREREGQRKREEGGRGRERKRGRGAGRWVGEEERERQ
jgi:hypothetical protein